MKVVAVDTETYGDIKENSVWDVCKNPIRMSYLSWWDDSGRGDVWANWQMHRPDCHQDQLNRFAREVLADEDILKVFWNASFDIPILIKEGYLVENWVDAMVMARILKGDETAYSLDHWTRIFLKEEYPEYDAIKKYVKKHKCEWGEIPYDVIHDYALKDARCTFELWFLLNEESKRMGMEEYIKEEMQVLARLIEAQRVGIKWDSDKAILLKKKCLAEQQKAQVEVYDAAGESFALGSIRDTVKVLYGVPIKGEKVGKHPKYSRLQPKWWTDKGTPSTNKAALVRLRSPVAKALLRYRELKTALERYYGGLESKIDDNNIIHGRYNMHTAKTGRLSSSGPNLQNMTRGRKGDIAHRVRECFTASNPGRILVLIDYAQMELRLAAHFSKDPLMLKCFNDGEDLHSSTTKEIFGIDEDDKDWKMYRYIGKTLNLSIEYGTGALKFRETIYTNSRGEVDITIDDARDFIRKWKKKYSKVAEFMTRCIYEAQQYKEIRTMYGRRIPVYRDFYAATNYLIQGTAAEVMKQALLRCCNRLDITNSWFNLTVHDELGFDMAPEDYGNHLGDELLNLMEDHVNFRVPLTCDMKAAYRWGKATEVKLSVVPP